MFNYLIFLYLYLIFIFNFYFYLCNLCNYVIFSKIFQLDKFCDLSSYVELRNISKSVFPTIIKISYLQIGGTRRSFYAIFFEIFKWNKFCELSCDIELRNVAK